MASVMNNFFIDKIHNIRAEFPLLEANVPCFSFLSMDFLCQYALLLYIILTVLLTLNFWLQTTQPTSGGAVTANSSCCANCVEPPRPRFTVFWACRPCGPAGCMALLLTKASDVETNPGPTTLNKKVWICDICHKQIHVRKQISIRCNRIEHWVHLRCAGIPKHNTQIPGPAIYTENPDSHLTQT